MNLFISLCALVTLWLCGTAAKEEFTYREVESMEILANTSAPECRWCAENLLGGLHELRETEKTTKPDLIRLFKDVCKQLPSSTTEEQETCVMGLNRNMHKIRKTLDFDLAGSAIYLCHHMEFCGVVPHSKSNSFWKPLVNKLTNTGEYCGTCMSFAKAVRKTYLDKLSNSEYPPMITNLCGHVSSKYVNEMCTELAKRFDEAWVVHELLLDPLMMCRNAELCNDDQLEDEQVAVPQETSCEDCKKMLEHYKKILRLGSFELDDRVLDAAKSICMEYGKKDPQACEREFLLAAPPVMNTISAYIQPESLCKELTFCGKKDVKHASKDQKQDNKKEEL